MSVNVEPFGQLPTGEMTKKYTITNSHGASVSICDYGARVVSIIVPDSKGFFEDVVLGYDSIAGYCENSVLRMGAVCGRVACRLANGVFRNNNITYSLSKNDRTFTLHGGFKGFDEKMWGVTIIDEYSIAMTYVSKDGEEGFPGTLVCTVIFSFDNLNSLTMEYRATTDIDTVCNLTNHTYFNLSGHSKGDILKQKLRINSNFYCENGYGPALTGAVLPVDESPFDFRDFKIIGESIYKYCNQLKEFDGYNHSFALNKEEAKELDYAATLIDTFSGRVMNVYTTMPCLLIFTSNKTEKHIGKEGAIYSKYGGICFETMHFNNALACPWLVSPVLSANQVYRSCSKYSFSTIG